MPGESNDDDIVDIDGNDTNVCAARRAAGSKRKGRHSKTRRRKKQKAD